MAKTLNQFLEGYLKVKNPDEQKFVDKHVVAKHSDRNGNDDDAFKGKTKQIDRRKERHGYNPGEDEKVYEELKGNQHKIDANKNGKVDAHDFHLLRKKKKVNEASYKEGETRMGAVGPITTDAERAERAKKYREKMMKKEEAEQIDELSTPTLQSYRKKARAQGNAIVDKMKMGGGDWSKDQKDTKTLRKRAAGAQASGKQLVKRGESLKTEEAEQIDELSKKTLAKYIPAAAKDAERAGAHQEYFGSDQDYRDGKNRQKGIERAVKRLAKEEAEQIDELSHATLRRYRMKSKAIGDNEKGDIGYRSKGRDLAARKTHGGQWGIPKAKVMAKEEVEDLDENAKVVAHLQKRYGDNIRKSHVRSAANDFGVGYVALAHAVRKKLGVNRLEEEQVDEVLTAKTPMGTYIKDFQKSDAPQFKGKSPEKRRAMAIAAKLTAERGGKPLRKEEKLADLLGDLTESHRRTMLSVFDKLNEDNQKKFLEACQTPEGVEYMLDFSISHRGE